MKLLCLDLSTASSGWALYDTVTQKPISYGAITATDKGTKGFAAWRKLLFRCQNMANQINSLAISLKPDLIVIEEINNSQSRKTAKALSMVHTLVLLAFSSRNYEAIEYIDSDGKTGWRTRLGLLLNEADKKHNKELAAFNKKLPKKLHRNKITKKHLACRYVNIALKLNFDVDKNPNDNDIVDALGIGLGWFKK